MKEKIILKMEETMQETNLFCLQQKANKSFFSGNIHMWGQVIFAAEFLLTEFHFLLVQTEHNFVNGWVRVLIIFVKNGWGDSPGDRCFLIC